MKNKLWVFIKKINYILLSELCCFYTLAFKFFFCVNLPFNFIKFYTLPLITVFNQVFCQKTSHVMFNDYVVRYFSHMHNMRGLFDRKINKKNDHIW